MCGTGTGLKQGTIITLAVAIGLIVLVFFLWHPISAWIGGFLDPEAIRIFLERTGPWAPVIFILLQAAQVVLAPIPMQVVGLAGGYLFGTFWGTVYSIIGLAIGSAVAIGLSRLFGRKLVERFVEPETLEKFDHLAEKGGLLVFFLIFLLPALPDDAICFIAGLTSLRLSSLIIVAVLGRLPGLLYLTLVGEQMRIGMDWVMWAILIASILLFAVAVWFLKPHVERWFSKGKEEPPKPTDEKS